jgi:hypothetical protein
LTIQAEPMKVHIRFQPIVLDSELQMCGGKNPNV